MSEHADTHATEAAREMPRLQLDAYPRLCGLPVTFERLVPTSVPPQPGGPPAPPSSGRRP